MRIKNMKQFNKLYEQIVNEATWTAGQIKAMGKSNQQTKGICPKCGTFHLKYEGRYPKTCGVCGDPLNFTVKPGEEAISGAGDMKDEQAKETPEQDEREVELGIEELEKDAGVIETDEE